MPTISPFGSWASPISAEFVTQAGTKLTDTIEVDGDDIYWIESRPSEGGRSVIVRRRQTGDVSDAVPSDFNARTRVHEYGGGAYTVADGVIYSSRFEDQRLYRIVEGAAPEPLTPEPESPAGTRFADPIVWGQWIVAVRESHPEDGSEPSNDLVRIPIEGGEPVSIAGGHDFYSNARVSPDGTQLAWLTWDHPNMPWDGSDLWTADLDPEGLLGTARHVAGGPDESVYQPEWSPAGHLHFISDRTGWWNLYAATEDGVETVYGADVDLGTPQWVFGTRRYTFLGDGRIVAVHGAPDGAKMLVIDDGSTRAVRQPFTSIGVTLATQGDTVLAFGADSVTAPAVVSIDVESGTTETVYSPPGPTLDADYISAPQPVTFESPEGPTHALFYPPTNPDFVAPHGELPPLIVEIHGGPTSAVSGALKLGIQYWTSRGFGVVDVDYGGSTGYGRAYRDRLKGTWGIVDVRDCALAASHLAEAGLADRNRLIITGGSAGGFTTLAALALRDEFAVGTSYYGVADLEALASDTHKFESRYLDSLVGPYPEAKSVYEDRSPINHVDGINRPVLLLQGMDDRVVPPEQAEMMYTALKDRGIPVAMITFEGEGHGFRKAENQITALETELVFYGKVFGFEPEGELPDLEIAGL